MSYIHATEPGEDDQLICPSCDYPGGPEEFDGPFGESDVYYICPECSTIIYEA